MIKPNSHSITLLITKAILLAQIKTQEATIPYIKGCKMYEDEFLSSESQNPSPKPKGCRICYSGYFIIPEESKCGKCPYGCIDCTHDAACISCYPSYFLNKEHNCEKCSSDCKRCDKLEDCFECMDGHFKNSEGKCVRCLENCAYCINSESCIECHKGYPLSADKKSCVKLAENSLRFTLYMTVISGIGLLGFWCFACLRCFMCNKRLKVEYKDKEKDELYHSFNENSVFNL